MRPLLGIPLGLAWYAISLPMDVLYEYYPVALSALLWAGAIGWVVAVITLVIAWDAAQEARR